MSIFYDKKYLKLFSPDLSCARFEVFWVFPVGLRGDEGSILLTVFPLSGWSTHNGS